MLPVLLFVSSRFRPPKYLGIPPRPRESPGSTRTGRLLGLSHPPDRGWVVPRVSSERGWGLSSPGSRRGYGSTAAHDFWEHDNRHTLVTELAESGAGDKVFMSIAGHVSRHAFAILPRGDGGQADGVGRRGAGARPRQRSPRSRQQRPSRCAGAVEHEFTGGLHRAHNADHSRIVVCCTVDAGFLRASVVGVK